MNPEAVVLIDLVASVLQHRGMACSTADVDWERLFKLARRQRVANIVGYALEREDFSVPSVPKAIQKRFAQEKMRAIYAETLRGVEMETVCRDFDANRVCYMPLKGSVTKNWYPSPDMRMMTDTDVLVEESARKHAGIILKERGFRAIREGQFCDDIFVKPPATTIEIHRQLFEPNSRYARLDDFVWKDARRVDATSFLYEASPEVFYLHHVTHLARHFETSGIDLRFLIDLWLMKKRRTEVFDCSFVNHELDAFRLNKFVHNIERLADVWFEGAPSDPTLDELGRYVLSGADYQDVMANQLMDQTTKPIDVWQKLSFFWSRLFLSKKAMARRYACVERYPFLLPIFWIRHFFASICSRETRKKILGVLRVNKHRVNELKEFHRHTGLKDPD